MDFRKINPWSNAEVQMFLCLAADEKLQSELDAPRNEKAYRILSEQMAMHGFERSSQQCRDKLKKMKSDYFRTKKHSSQSTERRTLKWYSQLDAIYGRRTFRTTSLRGLPDALSLSSLRLLVSPLQLMAAALWGVMQHRAVLHYELLEDIITAVLDIVPELLTHSERVQLVLGLRTKLVLEMCRRDDLRDRQKIEPHLKKMDDLINQEDDETSTSKIKASVANFIKVVDTLLEDPHERDVFYQETFPCVFDLSFDSALRSIVRKFLMNLEKLLPAPSFDQTSLWLGLSPPVLKECGDIMKQPESLSELIQHHIHGFKFLPVQGDDIIFSSFSQISSDDTKSKTVQKCKSSAPEEDMEEDTKDDVLSVKVTKEENDTNPQDCNTSLPFVYQTQTGSGKNLTCFLCGKVFGSFSEMRNHSVSGCSANTIKEDPDTCDERKEDEHLLEDSESNSESLSSNKSRQAESSPPEELQQSWSSDPTEGQMCKRSSRIKTCSVCGEAFTSSVDLSNHMRAHTGEDGSYSCGECDKSFDNYKDYMLHQENGCKMIGEHSVDADYSPEKTGRQKDINCSDFNLIKTCNLNSLESTNSEPTPNQTSNESENVTSNQSTMKCTLCDKTFSKLIIMRKHYEYSHDVTDQFSCPVCKRTFVRLYDLVKHHENKLLFQCDTCKWCFTSQSELISHKKQFNGACGLLDVCDICGMTFKHDGQLSLHKASHLTKESPVCTYCDKKFSSHLALKVHMNRHTGGFSCPICAKVFHQKIFLRRHMDRHNGQEPYLCEICGKGWPTEKYLKVHMIKHSDERPFTCDQCGMSFKSEGPLKSHFRRKHTDYRPFKCTVCSKAFAFTRGLKLHMMRHTGVRPFVCSRCGKGFRRSDELKTHQKTKCF